MIEIKHTPGPWRWEYNAKHRSVHLVGGKPQYDLTVMDFERWGMHGAVPRFIEPSESMNGLMIMHRLSDRQDWIAPFENREHHANWCAAVTHPDARLMAAAPELLEALRLCYDHCRLYYTGVESNNVGEAVRAAIAKATGSKA
jgi:hypothetical protein